MEADRTDGAMVADVTVRKTQREGDAGAEDDVVGEDAFGRMGGFETIAFGDGCLTIDGGTVCERI